MLFFVDLFSFSLIGLHIIVESVGGTKYLYHTILSEYCERDEPHINLIWTMVRFYSNYLSTRDSVLIMENHYL